MKLSKMCRSWSWHLQVLTTGFLIICPIKTAYSEDYQQNGPIITPSVSEVILKKGENFTIYCQANTPVQIKQQEIPEESTDTFKKVLRNVTSTDIKYEYKIALDLYNVDQFSVGYYGCFDETVEEKNALNYLIEEPKNNNHISYIYVYVNETGSLFAPMQEIVSLRDGSKVVIECRPTTPDVNVTLIGPQSNKTPEFIKYSPKIGFLAKDRRLRLIGCKGQHGNDTIKKYLRNLNKPPLPKIVSESKMFLKGEVFSLNCTVPYQKNSAMELKWDTPHSFSEDRILYETNEHEVMGGILYKAITIFNATEEDDGRYTCICQNGNYLQETSSLKTYKGTTGFIELPDNNINKILETSQRVFFFATSIKDYPKATIQVMKDGVCCLPKNSDKYKINKEERSGLITFKITQTNINDTGMYTFNVENKYVKKSFWLDLRINAAPTVTILSNEVKNFQLNTMASFVCEVTGYPQPIVKWIFSNDEDEKHILQNSTVRSLSVTKVISEIKVRAYTSGNLTCYAENAIAEASATIEFIVYEVPRGFGLKTDDNKWWYAQGQELSIECYASKYEFINVTWKRDDDDTPIQTVRLFESPLSYIAQLRIKNVSLDDEGNYTCEGFYEDDAGQYLYQHYTIAVTVAERRRPAFTEPIENSEVGAFPYQPIRLNCQAMAIPPPLISWQKDGEELHNTTDGEVTIFTEYLNEVNTIVNSSVEIKQMSEEYKGKYECIALSDGVSEIKAYSLVINDKSPYKSTYLSIAGAVVILLIIVVAYLAWRIRKEKQFRKELAEAGLLYFKEGVPKSLNPELGIDEQAELLPYDEKFEFPPEKLIIGKQLGAGAFGVVYKAEARGIINAEEITPVAVKMVKKTADNMYIKALTSELKIMVHLGKHINIVNLLGACTKNAGKRELIVIVEYCKFGNIHNYIQRHREVFIDQLTDNKDKNLGKVNRAFSSSTGTGASDYFASNHTQNTDNTFVNTVNSNRSGRKVSETGYVQPEWRSNYQSDYSYDGRSPRPLTSRDLLAWAFQIARGMEYLASRKVLHGDLAARNVLLAEDNIVKICDFGLARSIYKNDEYKKQENSPLPIKWLAIECMTDRIFSTQSDVWSFGVVLWELFSLAKTPYPNVSPSSFLQFLSDGHRLEKPQYADDQLYDVMLQCWEQKPTSRPNFTRLQEILGSFLEAKVRNHYVDLNSAYNDMNMQNRSYEDYLEMVCSPDYNNLVTPSPHHYANDAQRFILPGPDQLQHDSDGYLQMSPARKQSYLSPHFAGNKFDFDTRKINMRMTDPTCQGSELTPMLTLNNLPAKGSESDHDGHSLPYHSTCTPLEEETDDVFEMKQYNFKNSELNKNTQNSAVTNPTYISFDVDKKPQNVPNNYININVPNGLVK